MPEDDDINCTVMGLEILEEYGPNFTPDDVAEYWLKNLPILHVYTSERVVYRNLVNCIYPPKSAYFRNLYREWIGPQIRADFLGIFATGNQNWQQNLLGGMPQYLILKKESMEKCLWRQCWRLQRLVMILKK